MSAPTVACYSCWPHGSDCQCPMCGGTGQVPATGRHKALLALVEAGATVTPVDFVLTGGRQASLAAAHHAIAVARSVWRANAYGRRAVAADQLATAAYLRRRVAAWYPREPS